MQLVDAVELILRDHAEPGTLRDVEQTASALLRSAANGDSGMATNTGGRRRGERRASIRVTYDGQEYERDLATCRRALIKVQLDGLGNSMRDFARAVGVSRSTVSRFLSGDGPTTKDATDRILAGLKLSFDDVHRKVEPVRGEGRS